MTVAKQSQPWNWMFDPRSGYYVSSQHAIFIVPTGVYFRVANERGMWLTGPKRVRQFKDISAAYKAADAWATQIAEAA